MPEICLTLLCHAELEERVLDTLLLTPELSIFTSTPIFVHGLSHAGLDEAEQVLGRADCVQVQALMPEQAGRSVVEKIKIEFAGARIRYWLTPLIASGDCA